jgi:hypothetical protein
MSHRIPFACLALTLAAIAADRAAASTAVFRLSSPLHRSIVRPGAVIPWSITVALSAADNAGLALALVDLVQDEGNPGQLDIPPAERVPGGLERLSLPLGISNPGEGGAASGYIGLERGPAGRKDLAQLGGAQNTFGQPGGVMGQQTAVITGLAQGRELVLARGSFVAPRASGSYRFALADAAANVLLRREAATGHWRVEAAEVDVDPAGLTITVSGDAGPSFVRGDANRDGAVDISDASTILGFLFLGAPPRLGCEASADSDGSGEVEMTDAIHLLYYLFFGGQAPVAPHPACGPDSRPVALSCEAFGPCS